MVKTMDEEEKTKEQKEIDKKFAIEFFKKEAAKDNVFAKDMLNHYENNDNNNKKDSDFFEPIFGYAGALLVIFIFGVIIFAVIKWAFQMVF
ncbi:MAG: hypothetical protein COT33_01775 [Candidatus Nealsonbacteria bacterium CG08_land_8_20_14_0_20_38_20]|uniref:Uncharacterized protein n=1 Tax=Candidatus Nealsonbacteria bacterium CG08_land_8_20_14_0_20_38_20 TaxID=1974705 RepID=A0A2H0YLV1_9BACT|nr:MAG: hypothetical protein COT33_01775 [Candidatus Nealsonbacteria bacterium CG08_land_8_20_14_0_20_38_20]